MPRNRIKNRHFPPHLHQKGNAFYYVTVDRKWIPLGSDYSEALRLWARYEGKQETVTDVASLLRRYIEHKQTGAEPIASATLRRYRSHEKRLAAVFGAMQLDDVRPGHVARYLDEHPNAPSANNEIALLSAAYRLALRWELTARNPCEGIARHRLKARDRYISDAEFIAVREKAPDWLKVMMDLAYLTGLRAGDIRRLKLSDARDGVLSVMQHKTKRLVKYAITPELQAVLDEAMRLRRTVSTLYVIASPRREPYGATAVSKAFAAAAAAAGVANAHFHDIRAKNASDEPAEAQKRLDHDDAKTTRKVYLRRIDPVNPLKKRL